MRRRLADANCTPAAESTLPTAPLFLCSGFIQLASLRRQQAIEYIEYICRLLVTVKVRPAAAAASREEGVRPKAAAAFHGRTEVFCRQGALGAQKFSQRSLPPPPHPRQLPAAGFDRSRRVFTSAPAGLI